MIALQLKANNALVEEIESVLPKLTKKMTGELPSKFLTARNARALARPNEQPEQVHVPTLAYVTLRAMHDKAVVALAHGKKGFEQIISYDAAVCVKMELSKHRIDVPLMGPALFNVLEQVARYTALVERMDREQKQHDAVRHNSGALRRSRKVARRVRR